MRRVVLVCWNAKEADDRAGQLRRAGYAVTCHCDPRANPGSLRENPPDAFVIDLSRIPSQGRELGGWLRRGKATRHVSLVFVGGDPAKTARVRDLLPDATYTTWSEVSADLAAAIASPLDEPTVPGAMDAYRGVPLCKRLGIGDDTTVALVHAPSGFEAMLRGQPSAASATWDGETADVILWFETSIDSPERGFGGTLSRLREGGRLWIAWPKKTSGVASDLSQIVVRAFGLGRGLVDYKIAAIDETWSALCFARRGTCPRRGRKETE